MACLPLCGERLNWTTNKFYNNTLIGPRHVLEDLYLVMMMCERQTWAPPGCFG